MTRQLSLFSARTAPRAPRLLRPKMTNAKRRGGKYQGPPYPPETIWSFVAPTDAEMREMGLTEATR